MGVLIPKYVYYVIRNSDKKVMSERSESLTLIERYRNKLNLAAKAEEYSIAKDDITKKIDVPKDNRQNPQETTLFEVAEHISKNSIAKSHEIALHNKSRTH